MIVCDCDLCWIVYFMVCFVDVDERAYDAIFRVRVFALKCY